MKSLDHVFALDKRRLSTARDNIDSGVSFVSVKDFSSGHLNFTHTRHISQEEHLRLIQRCKPERGDILIGRIGTLGKRVVVDTDREFSLFVSVGLLKPRRDIVAPEYLRAFLDSRTASAASPNRAAAFDRINGNSMMGMMAG